MAYTFAADILMAGILAASASLVILASVKKEFLTKHRPVDLLIALIPYALCCTAFRVLYDLGMAEYSPLPLKFGFYTIGFGMLATIPLAFMFAARFSIWLAKSTSQEAIVVFKRIGYKVALPTMAFLAGIIVFPGKVFAALLLAGILWVGLLILSLPFGKFLGTEWDGKYSGLAQAVILTQAIDASATYAILRTMPETFVEEHVIPRLLIGWLGPWSFLLLKAAFTLLALWLIVRVLDRWDSRLATSAALFLVFLGIITGTRNLVLLGTMA